MRINRYVAAASGLGRRKIDGLINEGRIKVDDQPAVIGQQVTLNQQVTFDGNLLALPEETITIMLNKPPGYVVSKKGQGSLTIYSLLPKQLWSLKPVGRLDKDSSGLLLLSNDGLLINNLGHPSRGKQKIYEVSLNKGLTTKNINDLSDGIRLTDGISRLNVLKTDGQNITIALEEGRNRQIRRTIEAIGLSVISLKRTAFGPYKLDNLASGHFKEVKIPPSSLLE